MYSVVHGPTLLPYRLETIFTKVLALKWMRVVESITKERIVKTNDGYIYVYTFSILIVSGWVQGEPE